MPDLMTVPKAEKGAAIARSRARKMSISVRGACPAWSGAGMAVGGTGIPAACICSVAPSGIPINSAHVGATLPSGTNPARICSSNALICSQEGVHISTDLRHASKISFGGGGRGSLPHSS